MNMVIKAISQLTAAALLLVLAANAGAATVWTGPVVEFSKTGADDPSLEENQDRLTPLVWLTRGANAGLYNIAQEEGFQRFQNISPAGTLWAFEGLNGNPDDGISAASFDSLVFTDFTSALGVQQIGRNIVGRPGVVNLVEEDIYFDILFTAWGSPTEATIVTYQRTSPIPVPAAVWLLGSALGALGFVRRRRCAS